jgi:hypothetical protein
MAKRPSSSTSTSGLESKVNRQTTNRPINISEIIANSDSENTREIVYSNHVQITASANEFIMDFFLVSPDPVRKSEITSSFLQRVIMPINIAQSLTSAIAQNMANLDSAMKNLSERSLSESGLDLKN